MTATSTLTMADDTTNGSSSRHAVDKQSLDATTRRALLKQTESVSLKLRRRQLLGSHPVALQVTLLLKNLVANSNFGTFEALLDHIRDVGLKLEEAGPKELVIPNIVLRVLKSLREEFAHALNESLYPPSPNHSTGAQTPNNPLYTPFLETPSSSTPFFTENASGATATSSSGVSDDSAMLRMKMAGSIGGGTNMVGSTSSGGGGNGGGSGGQGQGHLEPPTSIFTLLNQAPPFPLQQPYDFSTASAPMSDFVRASNDGSSAMSSSIPSLDSRWSTPTTTPTTLTTPTIGQSSTPSRPGSSLRMTSFSPADATTAAGNVGVAGGNRKKNKREEEEFSKRSMSLKPHFDDAIQELVEELSDVHKRIEDGASEYVNSAEIIMTLGYSRTIESFLRGAAKKRKFQVIVAETAPLQTGRRLAQSLSTLPLHHSHPGLPIPTTLIPDSNVFAIMSRCTRVLLPAHAVLADGSLIAPAGSLVMGTSARLNRVPVVAVVGLFKFCPGIGRGGFGGGAAAAGGGTGGSGGWEEMDFAGPEEVLRDGNGNGRRGGGMGETEEEGLGGGEGGGGGFGGGNGDWGGEDDDGIWGASGRDGDLQVGIGMETGFEVLNPRFDRVPGDLVNLFVTNLGSHPPTMLYQLLKDLYG